MSDCPYVYHMGAGALGGHKGESESLELEIQAVVSCLMWVLGTELWLRSYEWDPAVHVLSHTLTLHDFFWDGPWCSIVVLHSVCDLVLFHCVIHTAFCVVLMAVGCHR